jgi:hypothetical protein
VRAAGCLGVPLLAGLLTGQRLPCMMASIGAVWALSHDGADRWRQRAPRLASVAVASGLGILAGSAAAGAADAAWQAWLVLTAAALAAGWIEAGVRWAAAGMQFLLGVIVGGGLAGSQPPWVMGGMVTAGGLLVLLAAAGSDHHSRLHDQRHVIAAAFDALAALARHPSPGRAGSQRLTAIAALSAAQDSGASASGGRRGIAGEPQAAAGCLIAAIQVAEAIATLPGADDGESAALADTLARAANELRAGSAAAARAVLADSAAALLDAAHTPAQSLRARALLPPPGNPARSPLLAPRGQCLPSRDRARFALLLAGACVLAAAVADIMHGSRAYWLPLTVAFVCRPDLGPVIRRGAARTAGTLTGVAVAALSGLATSNDYVLLAVAAVCAGLLPAASRRGHAFVVSAFTPIVFVFLAVVGQDHGVLLPRIADTALGALIVMLVDLAFWTRAPSLRPAEQIRRAQAVADAYRARAATADADGRHRLRRDAFRAVAQARASVQLASAEAHPLRRPPPQATRQLDRIETQIDAATRTALRLCG